MFSRLLQSAEMWQKLTATQKMALGVALLILVLVTIIVARTASAPRYVQLYGNLTSEDAASVVQKLQELKVNYRLTSGGNSVEVPEGRVDEIRLSLAGEGLPRGGNVGFELFDKTQIGQSEFGERLNYLRALQGELARTIGQLRSVRSARVHLALPEHRLYSAEEQKPTASVVLDLQGPVPTPSEIKSIIYLVSSSVEGLTPANVTIIDTNNQLLSEMADVDSATGATSVRLQAQQTMARQIEQRVQSMLDQVLGPGKSIARANVKLNFDHKTIEREVYSPVDNKGVLESEHRSAESYNGTKPGTTGGPVGVVPNTSPTVPVTTTRGTGSGTYTREENTAQYRISKSVESTEVSPGQIERLSLALFVDEGVQAAQLESLKKTVATAVGIDIARGDAIEVQPMKFSEAKGDEDKAAKSSAWMSQLATIGKYVGGAVLLVIFLMVVSSIYRASLANAGGPSLPEDEYNRSGLPALPQQPMGALEQYSGTGEMSNLTMPEPVEIDLSDVDPKHVAGVIKELMAE